jgi:hypothetical protein
VEIADSNPTDRVVARLEKLMDGQLSGGAPRVKMIFFLIILSFFGAAPKISLPADDLSTRQH